MLILISGILKPELKTKNMKYIFRLSLLVIMGLAVFPSCSKRSPNNVSPAGPSNSMTGTFGGTKWTAATYADSVSSGQLYMEGTSSTNSFVSIQVPANITASTYQYSSGIYQIEYYYDATHYYFLNPGTVIIASNSGGVISGSFSGTFTNPATGVTLTATTASFTMLYK